MKIQLTPADALIIADVQLDFLPGGALGIANGEKVVNINKHFTRHLSSPWIAAAHRLRILRAH